jgi:hypothetical protein
VGGFEFCVGGFEKPPTQKSKPPTQNLICRQVFVKNGQEKTEQPRPFGICKDSRNSFTHYQRNTNFSS